MNKLLLTVSLATCIAAMGCGRKSEEELAEKLIERSLGKDGVATHVDIADGKMSFTATDPEGKKSKISMSEAGVTIDGEDGATSFASGAAAKVPKNFPEDVLVYPGCEIISSMTLPEGFNLILKSKDAADKVVARYKAEMADKGWKEDASINMGNQSILTYKKDNRTASLMIGSEDNTAQIALTVTTQKD